MNGQDHKEAIGKAALQVQLKDIRIEGGIHNDGHYAPHLIDLIKLEKIRNEIAEVIVRHTSRPAWVTVTFNGEIGAKLNS